MYTKVYIVVAQYCVMYIHYTVYRVMMQRIGIHSTQHNPLLPGLRIDLNFNARIPRTGLVQPLSMQIKLKGGEANNILGLVGTGMVGWTGSN